MKCYFRKSGEIFKLCFKNHFNEALVGFRLTNTYDFIL